MSSSFGGFGETAVSASRNMVLQKGHAAATISAPVAASSRARLWLTRSPFSSPKNASPPPSSTAKAALAGTGRIDHLTGCGDHCARLVIDAAIAPQIAGIVI